MSTQHSTTLVRPRREGRHHRQRDVDDHLFATISASLCRTAKAIIAWTSRAFQPAGRRKSLSGVSRTRMSAALPLPAPGEALSKKRVPAAALGTAATQQRRAFILSVVQPGLAGLMDGSISSLAPLFAAAFATRNSHTAFLVGLATAIGAGISMAFSEGLSDDGTLSGRGSPWLRGSVCGLMTFVGAVGHTLPFLIPAFVTAALIVGGVVIAELLLIAWIRHRYMDTPLLAATFQVVVGGVIVFGAGILIGSS
jgi:erythrin-vacuolar iron transport family protein